MEIGKRDQKSVQTLHSVANGHSQHRDASGSASNGSSARQPLWTQVPTVIQAPGVRRRPVDILNPYSKERFSSNLNQQSPSYNPVASANAVGPLSMKRPSFGGESAAKRQRNAPPKKPGHAYQTKHQVGYDSNQKIQSKFFSDAPIVVDSEGEDIGTPVERKSKSSSPDPISGYATTEGEVHDFDKPLPKGKRPRSRVSNDGPSTISLRKKYEVDKRTTSSPDVATGDKDDPIEMFPDDQKSSMPSKMTPTRDSIVLGTVKDKIPIYDPLNKPRASTPHLDLQHVTARASVINKMKGKNPQKPPSTDQKDPIATSSTNFVQGAPSARLKGIQNTQFLPIEAWFYGTLFLPDEDDDSFPPYYLTYDSRSEKMCIKSKPPGQLSKKTYEIFAQDISELSCSRDLEFPLFQLKFFSSGPVSKTKPTDHFNPGSKGPDGHIHIRFCKTNSNFLKETYDKLIKALGDVVSDTQYFRSPGAQACWEMAKRASEPQEHQPNRKTEQETLSKRRSQKVQELRDKPLRSARNQNKSKDTTDRPPAKPSPKPRPKPRKIQAPVTDLEPSENEAGPSEPLRRSSRQSTAHAEARKDSTPVDQDELILVYPPTGTGAVNITRGDLNRLEPGEFLNDTLIEFGLKLWLNDLREKDPAFADQIHVFSSFFYKKLNNKKLEEGYQSVRKWTSKFDLFDKKYIIVPINEHLHWYLAIICQPEHCLQPPSPAPAPSISTRRRPRASNASQIEEAQDASSISATTTYTTSPLRDITDDSIPGHLSSTPPSDAQQEGEVEEMLKMKECSIYSDRPNSPGSSNRHASLEAIDVDAEASTSHRSSPDVGDAMDVDQLGRQPSPTLSSTGRADYSAIPPANFYGSISSKSKGKQKEQSHPLPMDLDSDVGGEQENVEETLVVDSSDKPDHPTAYIFILDSLNTRHPQAIKILKQYLKMEAKDKKGLSETTDATGKQAMVPMQPNYCDCGVYLLHFAKTFMEKPDDFSQLIMSKKSNSKQAYAERQALWNHSAIGSAREGLSSRITELSTGWKAEREQKLKEAKEKGDTEGDQKADSSDDDVVIEESIRSAPSRIRRQAGLDKGKEAAAVRIRG